MISIDRVIKIIKTVKNRKIGSPFRMDFCNTNNHKNHINPDFECAKGNIVLDAPSAPNGCDSRIYMTYDLPSGYREDIKNRSFGL